MKYIEKIESVQKRVTKQFPGMKNLSYPERLEKIGLPTLAKEPVSRGSAGQQPPKAGDVFLQRMAKIHVW
jgi:hypothetical protein